MDAAVYGARASYIGGAAGTATVLAGQMFGIPVSGTMAHSWVMYYKDEFEAFKHYAEHYPDGTVLLVDTYDVIGSGIPNAIRVAKEVLERVGLSHRMRHMPTQLSGGQCQRVAIARAIIGNPEIILADEPTGNLDSKMGAEVMELLHRLNKEDGRTIVMVTHNEEQAKQTSRTIRFFDGRQVQ